MPPRITHTTTSTQPDSGDGKISSNAWNEDHTIEGLGTAAASDVEDFAAAADLAEKLDATAISAFGLTLVDDADPAIARGTLGLGTAALQSSSYFALATDLASKQDVRKLTEHTTFYVSATTGDDGADGSPTPTEDATETPTGTPWATARHAADVLSTYDLNGYDATLQFLRGDYGECYFAGLRSSRANVTGLANTNYGTGTDSAVIIRGIKADPEAVNFNALADATIFKFGETSAVFYVIDDFTLDYRNPIENSALCWIGDGVQLFLGDGDGGTVRAIGQDSLTATQGDIFNTVWNRATIWQYDTLYIDGAFDYGFNLMNGSLLITQGEIALGPACNVGTFIWAKEGAYAELWHSTTGTMAGANTTRFLAEGAVIDARNISGSDLNTLPGNIAGIVSGGGAYLSATATLRDLSGFAAVAGTGDYADLTGKPTLATVALSGSAADLTGTLAVARLPAFTGGDVTSSAGSGSLSIANGAVTLAKQANMATASVIYRKTAGTGAPEVQTLATLKTDLGLTGTNSGDQTITLTGDVTGTGAGSFATAIGANKVTRAMMANTGAATVLGSTAAGAVAELTAAQAKTFLAITAADVTPPGSTTQVLFNDGGVLAGNAGLTFDKTNKALSVGGATVTTSNPVVNLTQTWNASGVTFTGITLNITNTAAAAASKLADLQVGGVSQFSVRKDGRVNGAAASAVFGGAAFTTLGYGYIGSIFAVGDTVSATNTVEFLVETASNNVTVMNAGMKFGWGSQALGAGQASALRTSLDTQFTRVSAGIAKISNSGGTFGGVCTQPGTVSALPSAAAGNQGTRAFVTDATATTFLSTVAGGGSNKVPVVSDGTNWLIG